MASSTLLFLLLYFINDINHISVIKRIKATEIKDEIPTHYLISFNGKDVLP
jgi:hypothetical protein